MLGEGHALLNQVASGICFQVLHIPDTNLSQIQKEVYLSQIQKEVSRGRNEGRC